MRLPRLWEIKNIIVPSIMRSSVSLAQSRNKTLSPFGKLVHQSFSIQQNDCEMLPVWVSFVSAINKWVGISVITEFLHDVCLTLPYDNPSPEYRRQGALLLPG